MEVAFREVDPFNVWLWLEFKTIPSRQEQDLVEEVLSSWFLLGKLGGFNGENLQVQDSGADLSYLEYDTDNADRALPALMHNMGEMEYAGVWGRCWFDLGTSDALGLDTLVNALLTLSQEYVDLERLIVGGENEDWPVDPQYQKDQFYADRSQWQG